MIPATSPKKRSLMPSGKLRQSLRGHGHRLSAIVQIGKAGITPGLVKQLEQALADHELVKLKVAADSPADRFAVADQLAALPGVNIVQIVGGMVLLYKRHPQEARYEGQGALAVGAKPAAATGAAPGRAKTPAAGRAANGKATRNKPERPTRRSKAVRRGATSGKKARPRR